jgi:hypothetical protein
MARAQSCIAWNGKHRTMTAAHTGTPSRESVKRRTRAKAIPTTATQTATLTTSRRSNERTASIRAESADSIPRGSANAARDPPSAMAYVKKTVENAANSPVELVRATATDGMKLVTA